MATCGGQRMVTTATPCHLASKAGLTLYGRYGSIRFSRYDQGGHFQVHRDGGFVINDNLRSVYTVRPSSIELRTDD